MGESVCVNEVELASCCPCEVFAIRRKRGYLRRACLGEIADDLRDAWIGCGRLLGVERWKCKQEGDEEDAAHVCRVANSLTASCAGAALRE